MEQVRNEQTIYSAAVYCRLSKDDEQAGESVSIETQKMMLTDFCHERGFSIYEIYADDGSGQLSRMTYNNHALYFSYSAGKPTAVNYNGTDYYYVTNLQGDVVAILDTGGNRVVEYVYDAWGKILSVTGTHADTLGQHNPLRYRGYVYDNESSLYYLQSRYYDPELGRFINADDTDYLGADGSPLSYTLFAYCKNNPIMGVDPSGHFLLSTAILVGAVAGGIIGASIGGISAYSAAKNNGAEGWKLAGWTALGALGGGTVGAAVGAAVGYGVGYIAGGTYANGLAAKSVTKAVNTFFSQPNKVHKLFKLARHNLAGYTEKTGAKLMRDTLAKGVVGAYKTVQKAAWAAMNSEVTFRIIDGNINVSDMWIK